MSTKKAIAGVDNTARRRWDKAEFADKAAQREKDEGADGEELTAADIKKRKRLERDPLHQGLIVERSNLKARDYQIDLTSRLNKTQVIGLNTPLSQQAGYYCSVCECTLRDSKSYLDHINGKYHNRALGMSMQVEKSTVEQVRNRLATHKALSQQGPTDDYLPDGIDRRLVEAEAAEERAKAERRERKKEGKRRKAEEAAGDGDEGADPDMLALMGFGGFGGGKN